MMRKKSFGLFSFIRVPEHQRFEYIPRYYDPAREALEARIKSIRQEYDDEDDKIAVTKARIRQHYQQFRMQKPKSALGGRLRFIFILTMLSLLAWWVFFS